MIAVTQLAAHLRIPLTRVPSEEVELSRCVTAAIGIVESYTGRVDRDLAPGRVAAIDNATLVIAGHLWDTRPGRVSRPGLTPAPAPPSKDEIPQLAYGLLLPYMRPPMG